MSNNEVQAWKASARKSSGAVENNNVRYVCVHTGERHKRHVKETGNVIFPKLK